MKDMMATATAPLDSTPVASIDEAAEVAVRKRYEGLVAIRTKAIKGKGAWYWAHLEPTLILHSDTGSAKAVKLRCSLCDALFSASNPSRTASEHLKRRTCPNFACAPKPISSIPPSSNAIASSTLPPALSPCSPSSSRKRNSAALSAPAADSAPNSFPSYRISPLGLVEPSRLCAAAAAVALPLRLQQPQQHLMLPGRKEEKGALAILEDSMKKMKSPKASFGPALSSVQVDSATELLADWLYESCAAAPFSCIEHPKFKAFLLRVGLPSISLREITGLRLDARYDEVRAESGAKIRDARFFQISSNGWRKPINAASAGENLVNIALNLPHGTSVYERPIFTSGRVAPEFTEEILWETITCICGRDTERCAGIVADQSKSLRNLERRNHWMVNLSCQLQAFFSLIKHFFKELQLFKNVTGRCFKLANFFNKKTEARNFLKYQLQERELRPGLLYVPPDAERSEASIDFQLICAMLEDISNLLRPLQLAAMDESYSTVFGEDPVAHEVAQMIRDADFWSELEAVLSLVKLVRRMAQEMESDRPLVSQCLPLWDELRAKVKDWCCKFNVAEGPVERVIDSRFKKNYHPAWSAAFILDPLYLIRDASGKYLPPFKHLKPDQEKDVDKLITRLVSREEAHIALMELMKWRSEGLDPLYAQAVQVKQWDPSTGKMKLANPPSSRLVWETCLSEFKSLGKVAVRLIFLRATSCQFKCNWSFLRWICANRHRKETLERAEKMVFIAAHSKFERREFSSEEDKDAELFSIGEDGMLDEVFVDASSV